MLYAHYTSLSFHHAKGRIVMVAEFSWNYFDKNVGSHLLRNKLFIGHFAVGGPSREPVEWMANSCGREMFSHLIVICSLPERKVVNVEGRVDGVA